MPNLYDDMDTVSQANGGSVFGDPLTDFKVRQDQLARRRALAQQMINQGMQMDMGSRMAGPVLTVGTAIPSLANIVAGTFMNRQLDNEQTDLAARQRQYDNDTLSGIPADAGPQRQQAQLKAMQNPSLREIIKAQMGIDESAQTRQFRQQEAEANRLEKSEQEAANRVLKAEENAANRQNQKDLRAMPTQHITISQGGGKPDAALDRQIKEARLEQMRNPKPKLTAAQSKAADDADVFLGHIDNAIDLLSANPDALGAKTMIPDIALQRIDPDGVATRAAVGGLAAEKVHQLSGAAVSAAEFARLRPYLPASGDSATTVQKKLQGLRKEAERIRARHQQGQTDAQPTRLKFNPATGRLE